MIRHLKNILYLFALISITPLHSMGLHNSPTRPIARTSPLYAALRAEDELSSENEENECIDPTSIDLITYMQNYEDRYDERDNALYPSYVYETQMDSLIDAGASILATDGNGNTVLHYLSIMGNPHGKKNFFYYEWTKTAKKLIAKGADINAQNYAGQTSLHLARSLDDARFLIKQGAKVNIKDLNSETPMERIWSLLEKKNKRALDKDHFIENLLEQLSPTEYDSQGYTALHRLCMYDTSVSHVQKMLVKGANPNAASLNARKATPLHLAAASCENEQLWTLLLAHGADSSLRDGYGNTPFDLMLGASNQGKLMLCARAGKIGNELDGAQFLLQSNGKKLEKFKYKALMTSLKYGNFQFAQWMLKKGMQLPSNKYGSNPFHAISKKKSLKTSSSNNFSQEQLESLNICIHLLKSAGVCIDCQELTDLRTPLLAAALIHDIQLVEIFLNHGANPDIPDRKGKPALHVDSYHSFTFKKLLVDYGARVDVKDHKGRAYIPLSEQIDQFAQAIESNAHQVIKRMLNQGFYIKNSLNKIRISQDNSNAGIITLKLLLAHPLPGPIFEQKDAPILREKAFLLLCVLYKWKYDGILNVPRDIRNLLCSVLFPPAQTFIDMVPTKNLVRYVPIYPRHILLAALVARHTTHTQNQLNEIGDFDKHTTMRHILMHRDDTCAIPEIQEIVNPENNDTVLKSLIEESYAQVLTKEPHA